MAFDINITNGKIAENNYELFKKICTEMGIDIGREISLKKFVKEINVLISLGYIRRVNDTIEIKYNLNNLLVESYIFFVFIKTRIKKLK